MKVCISILLTVIIFGASFQNSLYYIDYLINKDYYESLCVNKEKPEMACIGKCQVKKEAQEKESPFSDIKYSLEINLIIHKTSEFFIIFYKIFNPKNIFFQKYLINILDGHYLILPHPPQDKAMISNSFNNF